MTAAKISKTVQRIDRWVNERKRFGGFQDPITQTTFRRDAILNRQALDILYRYNWICRRSVDIPAEDATREWIRLVHDDENRIVQAEEEIERLDLRGKIEEAIRLGRLYGGNILVLGVFDGRDVSTPLGIPRRTLFLDNVDRWHAFPNVINDDPNSPEFGEVEQYLIQRTTIRGAATAVVHASRIIQFNGNYLPRIERMREFGYGASIIENIYDEARNLGVASQSASAVLEDFVSKVVKMENLDELLNDEEGEAKLLTRMGLFSAELSVNNVGVIGKDEDFQKLGTPVAGIADLMDRFIDLASAATGIPKSRLFQNQSGRLGGDAGENDLRTHYDKIAAYQKNQLRSKIRRILDVVLAPLGFEPGEMKFEFNPLWQLSEADDAAVRLKIAQSDEIYLREGVVYPEEVAKSRFSGDGIDVTDMHIEDKPRDDFLKQLAKGETTRPGEPDLAALQQLGFDLRGAPPDEDEEEGA